MDDQSTLSRIEKLFPNDDLELNSTSKKPRRRRSAPSHIILRNFRRSTTVSDMSGKLPQPTDYVSRKFIFESPVQLTVGLQTQDRYLFLFNDVLFIAKQRYVTTIPCTTLYARIVSQFPTVPCMTVIAQRVNSFCFSSKSNTSDCFS